VDDQPVFVAAEIKDDSVVAHEIDGTTELPLYLGRIDPTRLGCHSEPSTNGVHEGVEERAFEEDDQGKGRQIRGFRALEEEAGIEAKLMEPIHNVESAAHRPGQA